jgi:hypothetical protein
MTEIDPPAYTQLGPGYIQIEFSNLKQFVDYLYSEMLDFEAYVWRGQRCDTWALETTLDRLIRQSKVSRSSDFIARHLEAFKYAARGRRGPNPSPLTDENDWWALGQHHDLATPLLDWSNSPFVAAYFAFSDVGESQTPSRAIFALHRPSVEYRVDVKKAAENGQRREKLESRREAGTLGILESVWLEAKAEPDLVFVRPFSDENNRLVSQRGLFTRSRTELSIEDWVQQHQHFPDDDSGHTLLKLLVPDTERTKCLQLLNRMNINSLSLFPDLTGASKYCTLLAQIDNY